VALVELLLRDPGKLDANANGHADSPCWGASPGL
jgi:hypothetical protein